MIPPNAEEKPVAEAMLPQVSSCGSGALTWPPSEEGFDPDLQIGSRIGPYTLLELIGYGGMGVVFKAEQQNALQRIVALKLIKRGMESGEVVKRFNQERQSLAILSHRGIASVFDAGSTDKGRPYFAMEYVPGQPITTFSDTNRLTIEQRLQLVIDICDAVQHAHFMGIIHRDLKPGNLLVIRQDADGGKMVAKVIDFGIAKAMGADADAPTDRGMPVTSRFSILGTPDYMSREQLSGGAVDTRSDVYSLGVILYELLTGQRPFNRGGGLPAISGAVSKSSDRDAVRPSKRVGQLDPADLASVSESRRLNLKTLQRTLKGDLDAIVLMAMEDKLEERYSTPADLARDIGRYLAHEPVLARRATGVYVARKFVRRHKGAVIAAGVMLALLLLGIVGTTAGMVYARAAERVADAQRRDAQRTLAELYPGTGLAAASRGDWSEAALWFAQSAKLAENGQGDLSLVALNRIRVEAAQKNCIRPVGAFAVDGIPDRLSFDPSGRYVLVRTKPTDTAGSPCTIWDLGSQNKVALPNGFTKISAVAWSNDGARVALANADKAGGMTIYRFPQFDQPTPIAGAAQIGEAKFDSTGRLLLGRQGRTVRVWQTDSGVAVTPSLKHPKEILSADFIANSRVLLTSCADDKARLISFDAAKPDQSEKPKNVDSALSVPHSGAASSFADASVAPAVLSGDLFVTIEPAGLNVRKASDGEIISTLTTDGAIQWLAANVDRNRIAVGVGGKLLTARQISGSNTFDWEVPAGPRPIGAISGKFSRDGKWILATFADGQVIPFALDSSNDFAASAPFHSRLVGATNWSPNGSRFATAQEGGLVRIWAMNEPSPFRVATVPLSGGRSAVRFSPDGKYLLPTGEASAEAREFHADLYATRVYSTDGTPAGPVLDPNGIIVASAFSRDGRTVIAAVRGESGNRLYFWDWSTGKLLSSEIHLPSDPRSIAIRPGAASAPEAAVLCEGGEVVIANITSRRVDRQLDVTPAGRARGIATGRVIFSPNGKLIATWGERDDLCICDAGTGLKFKIAHRSGVRDAQFSPDSAQILSLDGEGSARMIDAQSGAIVSEVAAGSKSAAVPLSGSTAASVTALVRFSPDGSHYFVVNDGIAHLFSRAGNGTKLRILSHPQPLTAAEFTPDGRWILAASKDGSARLWDVASAQLAAVTQTPLVVIPRTIDISKDGRRAVIAGDALEAEVLAIDALVSPSAPAGMTDAICTNAELLGGRALEGGALEPLTDAQWLSRWNSTPKSGTSGSGVEWHRQTGASLFFAGDYRAASAHLSIVGDKDRSDAARNAFVSAGLGNFEEAGRRIQNVLATYPQERSLHVSRGDMLLGMGKSSEAAEEFERAMNVDRTSSESPKWIRGHWWVSKSYPAGIDTPFPPETNASDLSVDSSLWTYTDSSGPWVDFNALLHVSHGRAGTPKTAFAKTFIYALEPQRLTLSVGTDDLGRVWLNDKVIYAYTGKQRGAFRGQGRILLDLQRGWNTFVAKVVDQGRSDHELFASLSSDRDDVRFAEAQVLGDRADAAGLRGDFDSAISDLAAAIELAPQDSQRWQQLSALKLNAGDVAGWRKLCKLYVDRFRDSKDRHVAERVARICSSADGSGTDSGVLHQAVERALAGGNDPYVEFFQLARGMVEYRAKNYADAADWMEKSRGSKNAGACHAIATFYLAMAKSHLNESDEAQRFFDEASRALDDLEKQSAERPAEWNDRLAARVAQSEAELLISAVAQKSQR